MAGQEPRANFKTPITVEEVLGSRMIAYPFRLLQCCLVTDRGGALILVAAERARSPVHLLGTGESVETPTVTGSAACSSPPAESLCRASRSSSTGAFAGLWNARHGRTASFLFRQCCEILLTTLEGSDLLACRTLKIHCEPKRPNEESGRTGRDILRDFGTFFRTEILNLLVVGLDLGQHR